MGKSTLAVESYPLFNVNHKNDKKQTKTRAAAKLAKIAKFGAQDKAKLKIERRLAKKTIDKSRDRKRKMKSVEAGIKTPNQENDDDEGVNCVLYLLAVEDDFNDDLKPNEDKVRLNYWDYWGDI